MARIIYQYKGLKAVPSKWQYGVVVENRYEPTWYKGSEIVDDTKVKERIKELTEITCNDGTKKYKNITVVN